MNTLKNVSHISFANRYDSRVKAMEVDERPTEDYSAIGGLDKQIQELVEAVVLPMTHKQRFKNLGIKPPKGSNFLYFFLCCPKRSELSLLQVFCFTVLPELAKL